MNSKRKYSSNKFPLHTKVKVLLGDKILIGYVYSYIYGGYEILLNKPIWEDGKYVQRVSVSSRIVVNHCR